MTVNTHIVALGGGGFSVEPENTWLDDYLLALTGAESVRVCFIPTASGDSEVYLERFYKAFEGRAQASHLGLFKRSLKDLRAYLLSQDLIYVGGGNTANMMAVWRVHGVDAILREAYAQGTVLCGVSAGALCWFDCGVTDSFGAGLAPLKDGLGLISGSHCPHYDGEELRKPQYRHFIESGQLPPGIAADDDVALHYLNGELFECVSAKPEGRAYRVFLEAGELCELALETRFLGEDR